MNYKFLDELQQPPTERQMEVIMSPAQLTVAIAGPGSGKTQTTAWRIKRVLEDGCSPHRIVCITFTNDAAAELAKRIGVKLGYIGTLHGYVLRLLMCYGDLIGFPKQLSILDEEEAEAFLQHQLKALNLKKVPKVELREALAKGPVKGGPMNDIALAVGAYFQKLQQTGTVDYDSMLVFGDRLITELFKSKQPLGEHLFVDEVQDSGDLDFSIYRKAPFKFKTFVGDPDQSIYSFRGGKLTHLIAMTRVEGAKVVALEENFRSDILICQAANKLIHHNKQRVAKVTSSRSGNFGEFVLRKDFDSAAVESRWIAQDITGLTDNVPEHLREVAVLCRTNHLVDTMTLALQASGIPVSKKSAPMLPSDWQKCRLFVSLMSNPDNDYLAKKWIQHHKGDAAANDQERFALTSLTSINSSHLHFVIPPLSDLPALLREHGLCEESIAMVATAMNTLPEQSTVHDLSLAIANTWSLNDTAGDGVTVSTIHSAKGREWDVVYLPAFEENIIPGTRKNVDIEEERRLAYVAVTRARHRLTITWCNKRVPKFGPQSAEPTKLSRYAAELVGAQ